MICHSCLPFLAAITGRTRLIRRSALVNVPSFSKNEVPGRNTCANFEVSFRNKSCTTTRSIALSDFSTCIVFGSDCAMSSPCTNNPRNSPEIALSNMFGIRMPGSDMSFTSQSISNCSRTALSETCRYPESSCGNEPMSHAPCTLFCPRSGLTPTPSRPMFPVAIARFAIPITMVEPWECSVTPRP